MEWYVLFVFTCVVFCSSTIEKLTADKPPGDPLFLTPFIRAGNFTGARNASRVNPIKRDVSSYSGFFTVDDRFNSNLFFWYFPAETNPNSAPVILWLQGGPGTSALSGLFNDNGPFYVKLHRGLKMRKYYWSQVAHVIYIDSPVGTGFSFTNSTGGYARNLTTVVDNLYESLLQYFNVFRELINNDFYIFGESYGAKCATMLAYKIRTMNPRSILKINLKGIAFQNGVYDPRNMVKYSDYLYQIGLADSTGMNQIKQQEGKIADMISQRKYMEAAREFDKLIVGDWSESKTAYYNLTHFSSFYNFLHFKDDVPYGHFEDYLKKDLIRQAIHVGNLTFTYLDHKVGYYLINELMQSVKPTIEGLLENYRVLFYVGQLDVIVNYPMTVDALKKLRWSGAIQYDKQPRQLWRVGDDIAGYSKTVKSFTELLVRNAGHRVSYDQPKWALDMVKRFTSSKPFNGIPVDV